MNNNIIPFDKYKKIIEEKTREDLYKAEKLKIKLNLIKFIFGFNLFIILILICLLINL